MIELYEPNPHKMTTPQAKAQCVHWFIETKSNFYTQGNYRSKYGRDPPSRPSIRLWHKKFMETGTVIDVKRSKRPRTSKENIKRVRQAFQRHSPKVSVWCGIMCNRIIGPFLFKEASITADVYLELLTEYVALN